MQQIAHWLEKLGLGQYAQRFAENDIDFEILCDLTDQDLEKIGVTLLGHRRKLLRAIATLKGVEQITPAVAAAPPATPRAVDHAERRQVTVMFSGLVGWTALSARMDPEDLRECVIPRIAVPNDVCVLAWPMPWPPRRSTTHELELQREVTTLQLKLLRVNSALAIKTQYATRLEYLLHQRSERIDELNSKREQSRAQVQRLGLENEILTAMIAAPPVDTAMLAPK